MNIDELIRMSLLEAERDAALAELRRVRPVVDKAKAWRRAVVTLHDPYGAQSAIDALARAADALLDGDGEVPDA